MLKKTFISLLTLLIVITITISSAHARKMEEMEIVVLKTIDKVSAYTRTFEIPVEKTVKFGASLFIKARACRKALPIEKPESAAFLQIWEKNPEKEKADWVFSGWMFASNPSISAMEHAVYDVWVVDCKNNLTSESPDEFIDEAAPESKQPLSNIPVEKEVLSDDTGSSFSLNE